MAGQEGGPMLRLRIRAHFLEREEEQGKVVVNMFQYGQKLGEKK